MDEGSRWLFSLAAERTRATLGGSAAAGCVTATMYGGDCAQGAQRGLESAIVYSAVSYVASDVASQAKAEMARQNDWNIQVAAGPAVVVAVPATISAGEALLIAIRSGAIYRVVVAGVRELINVLNVNGADNAGDTKPPLSDYKDALDKVHDEVGKLPKGEDGKFGSPQAGDSKKGYRLDPPHDGAAQGDAESKHYFNWRDYTGGKRGKGGRSGAIPIGD